jgi:hypothetical protein
MSGFCEMVDFCEVEVMGLLFAVAAFAVKHAKVWCRSFSFVRLRQRSLPTFSKREFVIPAKAGIHHLHSNFKQGGLILSARVMDSRLRGNDEVYVFKRL